jgi:hypothetical protein
MAVALTSLATADVQVNIRASGAQANPAIAPDPGGGAVVVWSSYYTTSSRSNDVLARRWDPNGTLVEDEFRVNWAREGNQTEPAVAIEGSGRCAIVWQGPGLEEEDIFLRLFDPNGTALIDELLTNSRIAGRQLYPRIAANRAGTFIVAWESRQSTEDGDASSVYAQLFDADGFGLGGEMLLTDDLYHGRYPDIAIDESGDFAAVWLNETAGHTVVARLFDPLGTPMTEPFEVSTTDISSVTRPSIAMNALGHFVIAWDGDPNRASEDDIHARLYDPNGTARGEPFLVNSLREGAQQWPRVAINDANEFVVVWEHDTGDPNLATEIFARRFDPNGQPAGEQFQLNTHALDKQRCPDVALNEDGSFVAVWESNEQDGSGCGVFAHAEPPAPRADPNEPAASDP